MYRPGREGSRGRGAPANGGVARGVSHGEASSTVSNSTGLFGSNPTNGSGSAQYSFFGYSTISSSSLISPNPPTPPTDPASLQKATLTTLEASLTTGVFVDSAFYLYSHRTLDGAVDAPLPIYANSEVLKQTAEHFGSLVSGGFSESFGGHAGMPTKLRAKIAAEEYEYESDSDLDEEEEEDERPGGGSLGNPPHFGLTTPTSEGSDNKLRKDASVATEPIEDPVAKASPQAPEDGALAVDAGDSAGSPPAAAPEDEFCPISTSIPVRHIVVIPDVAFKTFKALVYYAYTGEISFAELRSIRHTSNESSLTASPPLACSPKSMYRLADKYGISALKDLAAKNIRSQLSSGIAMREVLSAFTARYPEIIRLETEFICGPNARLNCLSDLPEWSDRLVNGELPHAGDALVELIRRLAGGS